MDHFGIPLNCECGKNHTIKISDFHDTGGVLYPKETIRLSCIHYYNNLREIKDINIDINTKSEGGIFIELIGRAYVGLWKIWLNW